MNYSDKIYCRDPFILAFDKKYYLYRTVDSSGEKSKGVECLISNDLENWSEPKQIYFFDKTEYKDFFWAPECHYYKGYFYIFTSIYCNDCGHRRVMLLKSSRPDDPFEFQTYLTPSTHDAIDGTLYIDKNSNPWLVFVHEWTSMPDQIGSMCAAKLSSDLKELISEPITLFYASAPEWHTSGVTDGPSMIRYDKDNLFMIWSNFCKDGYAIGLAKSSNGEIDGTWEQKGIIYRKNLKPFMKYDGGHACYFKSFDNRNMISYHSPNFKEGNIFETLTIREIVITKDSIEII